MFVPGRQTKGDRITHSLTQRFLYISKQLQQVFPISNEIRHQKYLLPFDFVFKMNVFIWQVTTRRARTARMRSFIIVEMKMRKPIFFQLFIQIAANYTTFGSNFFCQTPTRVRTQLNLNWSELELTLISNVTTRRT